MKVKCIAKKPWVMIPRKANWLGRRTPRPTKGPKDGDVVTMGNEYWYEGVKYYQLVEWPDELNSGYDSKWFVPLEQEFEKVEYETIKKENPVGVN